MTAMTVDEHGDGADRDPPPLGCGRARRGRARQLRRGVVAGGGGQVGTGRCPARAFGRDAVDAGRDVLGRLARRGRDPRQDPGHRDDLAHPAARGAQRGAVHLLADGGDDAGQGGTDDGAGQPEVGGGERRGDGRECGGDQLDRREVERQPAAGGLRAGGRGCSECSRPSRCGQCDAVRSKSLPTIVPAPEALAPTVLTGLSEPGAVVTRLSARTGAGRLP